MRDIYLSQSSDSPITHYQARDRWTSKRWSSRYLHNSAFHQVTTDIWGARQSCGGTPTIHRWINLRVLVRVVLAPMLLLKYTRRLMASRANSISALKAFKREGDWHVQLKHDQTFHHRVSWLYSWSFKDQESQSTWPLRDSPLLGGPSQWSPPSPLINYPGWLRLTGPPARAPFSDPVDDTAKFGSWGAFEGSREWVTLDCWRPSTYSNSRSRRYPYHSCSGPGLASVWTQMAEDTP